MTVRDYDEGDRPAVLRLADEQLGEGYLDIGTIGRAGSDQEAFIKIATVDGVVAGFLRCLVQDQEAVVTMVRGPLPRHLRLAQEIGVVKSIAVALGAQGRGLGTELLRAGADEFRKRGIEAACAVAWKRGDHINIKGVLERASFTPFAEVPDYWGEESLRLGYGCPACGTPPCRCSAVMYSNASEEGPM